MIERITRINRTLFELWTGILIFGVICQVFVFACRDKASYSLGLWIGVLTAALGALHMWYSLEKNLELGEKTAVRKLAAGSAVRYLFYGAVLILVSVSRVASPLSVFLGMMGLKAAAYLQPFSKKISVLLYGEEILPPLIEEPVDEQDV